MVPPSGHSLGVAEPCLPCSQACGLEDRELGRSWPGQRKEEEVRWTLRVTRRLWGLEGMLHRWMTLGKLIHQSLSFPICAMVLILTSYELNV